MDIYGPFASGHLVSGQQDRSHAFLAKGPRAKVQDRLSFTNRASNNSDGELNSFTLATRGCLYVDRRTGRSSSFGPMTAPRPSLKRRSSRSSFITISPTHEILSRQPATFRSHGGRQGITITTLHATQLEPSSNDLLHDLPSANPLSSTLLTAEHVETTPFDHCTSTRSSQLRTTSSASSRSLIFSSLTLSPIPRALQLWMRPRQRQWSYDKVWL